MPRETVRLTPSQYQKQGPVVEFDIETWECCRKWPIVVATTTWDPAEEGWKREAQWVRNCGLCGDPPRPIDPDRDIRTR